MKPSSMLPPLPRKTLARGCQGRREFQIRNPTTAAASDSSRTARFMSPAYRAKQVNSISDTKASEPARPSTPSAMFRALMMPTTTNTVNGSASSPMLAPMKPKTSCRLLACTPARKYSARAASAWAPMRQVQCRSYLSSSWPTTTRPRAPARKVATRRFQLGSKMKKPATTANRMTAPPVTGIGQAWSLRPPGLSSRPQRRASGRVSGTSRATTAIEKAARAQWAGSSSCQKWR